MRPHQRRVGSLEYAMSFARGTRYDSPLRLCRDIKMRGRMPDIDCRMFRRSTRISLSTASGFLHFLVEKRFNGS